MGNHCGPARGFVWEFRPLQLSNDPCAGYAVSLVPAKPVLWAGLFTNLVWLSRHPDIQPLRPHHQNKGPFRKARNRSLLHCYVRKDPQGTPMLQPAGIRIWMPPTKAMPRQRRPHPWVTPWLQPSGGMRTRLPLTRASVQ